MAIFAKISGLTPLEKFDFFLFWLDFGLDFSGVKSILFQLNI